MKGTVIKVGLPAAVALVVVGLAACGSASHGTASSSTASHGTSVVQAMGDYAEKAAPWEGKIKAAADEGTDAASRGDVAGVCASAHTMAQAGQGLAGTLPSPDPTIDALTRRLVSDLDAADSDCAAASNAGELQPVVDDLNKFGADNAALTSRAQYWTDRARANSSAASASATAHSQATATSSTLSASGTFTLIGADVIKIQGSANTGGSCTGEYYLGPAGNEDFLDVHAGAYVTFYDENHTVVGSGELRAGRLVQSKPMSERACQFPFSAENLKSGALFYTVAIASHQDGTRFTAEQLNTIQLNYRSINPVQQSPSIAPEGAALLGAKVADEIASVYGPEGVTGVKCPSTMPIMIGKVYACTANQNIDFNVTILSPHQYTWQARAGFGSAGQAFPIHTGRIG